MKTAKIIFATLIVSLLAATVEATAAMAAPDIKPSLAQPIKQTYTPPNNGGPSSTQGSGTR